MQKKYVYIPTYWTGMSATDLECLLKTRLYRLNDNLDKRFEQQAENEIAWLRQRIPRQKTLELLTNN